MDGLGGLPDCGQVFGRVLQRKDEMKMINPKKVLIHAQVLNQIHLDARTWQTKGLESDGYLMGKIHLPHLVFEITDFIDGGPRAKRTQISCSGDSEYATKKKSEIQAIDQRKRLLGEYHLHPWNGHPSPSSGDLSQLQKVKNGKRPWFFIMMANRDGFSFWDLDREGTRFIEIPHQVLHLPVQTEISTEGLLDRVLKVTQNQVLATKTCAIVGLGSGGSVITKYLSLTGIGRIILADNDDLELVNVVRHEGTIKDIGKPKTKICKKIVESHNPFVLVETYDIDVLKERKVLAELVAKSDLLVASSGNAKVNNLLNAIALEKKVPVVYGGIFAGAKGGYILPVVPEKTPCFNCLFDLASKSYHVDKDAVAAYNIPEDELHAQQGLWIDISIPALMATKIALMIIQGQTEFLQDYNFLLYKNPFEMQRLKLERRQDCVVCNFEGWAQRLERTMKPATEDNRKRGKPPTFGKVTDLFSRRNKKQ